MNLQKTLRFVALTAVLGVMCWLAVGAPAQAYPPCTIHGNHCSYFGQRTYCGGAGDNGLCICNQALVWDCGDSLFTAQVGLLAAPSAPNQPAGLQEAREQGALSRADDSPSCVAAGPQ